MTREGIFIYWGRGSRTMRLGGRARARARYEIRNYDYYIRLPAVILELYDVRLLPFCKTGHFIHRVILYLSEA